MSQRTTRAPRTAEAAVDRLEKLYADATAGLSAALDRYLSTGEPPSAAERATFRYPLLRVVHRDLDRPCPRTGAPSAACSGPASTRPPSRIRAPSAATCWSSSTRCSTEYGARIEVAVSDQEIPYPYVLERTDELTGGNVTAADLARHFPTPQLSAVGDEIADGQWEQREGEPRPLSLFDAARVDYSLRRLVHYTGSDWRHVQQWILLTNYHRYVDQFIRWGRDQLADAGTPFTRLVLPGGVAHRARRSARAGAMRSSPATHGIASRCRPITWSRRTARA